MEDAALVENGDGEAYQHRGGVEVKDLENGLVQCSHTARKAANTASKAGPSYSVSDPKLSNLMADRIFVCSTAALTGHQTPVPAFGFRLVTSDPCRYAALLALIQQFLTRSEIGQRAQIRGGISRVCIHVNPAIM